jgi:hypothetical protein
VHRVEQPADVGGVVGSVGVHLADRVVARCERPGEARTVGGAEAGFGWPVQHVHAVVALGEPIRDIPGAVGGVVVDDEHVGAGRPAHRFDDAAQRRRLVVRRDDDDRSHRACPICQIASGSGFPTSDDRCRPRP